ncbi:hypothetical protein CWATWH0005_1021 [Crocosphaera watsonii WH 0005]|uniref:Uncharacterized protein n=1 Tax=Crocosphaera watsonii WH 0005 TaxID=423472 RepID=T2J246_CROWT|nr:hypothetical protein CWATWH0005_1021 [Crocosphaera watsonii WH 0005]
MAINLDFLGNCSPQQESIIEKHYKQHQLRKKKRMLKMDW